MTVLGYNSYIIEDWLDIIIDEFVHLYGYKTVSVAYFVKSFQLNLNIYVKLSTL